MNDSFIITMYSKIRKSQYGEWRNLTYRRVKANYIRSLNYTKEERTCLECGNIMKNSRERTVDHIIPLWICRDYGMPQLEFDVRNFRFMHAYCNTKRGNKENDMNTVNLPPKLKAKIMSMQPI